MQNRIERILDRFDHAVRRPCRDHQPFTDVLDRLVMTAVDRQPCRRRGRLPGTEQLGKPRAAVEMHVVRDGIRKARDAVIRCADGCWSGMS